MNFNFPKGLKTLQVPPIIPEEQMRNGLSNLPLNQVTSNLPISQFTQGLNNLPLNQMTQGVDQMRQGMNNQITQGMNGLPINQVTKGMSNQAVNQFTQGIGNQVTQGLNNQITQGMNGLPINQVTKGMSNQAVNQFTQGIGNQVTQGLNNLQLNQMTQGVDQMRLGLNNQVTQGMNNQMMQGFNNLPLNQMTQGVDQMRQGLNNQVTQGMNGLPINQVTKGMSNQAANQFTQGIGNQVTQGLNNMQLNQMTQGLSNLPTNQLAQGLNNLPFGQMTQTMSNLPSNQLAQGKTNFPFNQMTKGTSTPNNLTALGSAIIPVNSAMSAPSIAPTQTSKMPLTPFGGANKMPTAFNGNTFQNLLTGQNDGKAGDNKTGGKEEKPIVPVTLSWNVNAYAEVEKPNIANRCFTEIKNRVKNRNLNPKDLKQLFKAKNTTNVFQNLYRPFKNETKSKNKNEIQDSSNMNQNVESNDPNTNQNQPIIISSNEGSMKHILRNVTGIVQPGQLCAILGASGAGKTTLLNVINFRNRGKLIIDGDVKINGKTVGWREIQACSGYVPQDYACIGTLNVKEHLTFLAVMKMDSKLSQSQKYERVDLLLNEMNLAHVKDTVIGQGDRLRGISGGEKRRLAIASEILSNPQLLFCDEPTSGLDFLMGQSVADTLSYIARQGKTVISTIHQPTSQIFEKFDILCILAEGRVAYFGPSRDAEDFFASIGRLCPPLYNPADHYIKLLSITPDAREESIKKIDTICDAYDQSDDKRFIVNKINATNAPVQMKQSSPPPIIQGYNASLLTQMKWLLWRQSVNSLREPVAGKVLIIQTLFVSIFLGLIYLQLKQNEKGVMNRNGVLFVLLMQTSFGYFFPFINSFPLELTVFYRETKNKVYSALPYYLAKQIAEFPKFVILPFILVTITYWMADVNKDGGVYITITFILLLSTHVTLGLGILLSILAPNINAAVGLAAPILLPLLIFAGYYVNNSTTPDYFVWIKYISFYFYANEAYTIKLWKDVSTIDCSLPNYYANCSNPACYRNGNDVLSSLAISKSNYDRDIGLLILLLVIPRVLGYFVLLIKSKKA